MGQSRGPFPWVLLLLILAAVLIVLLGFGELIEYLIDRD